MRAGARHPVPGEQWLSPGKRSMGFWPTVLVNWMCPLCLCANKLDVTSPPANLVGLQGRCPPWKGSVASWWEHMELSDQSAPWQDR